MVRRPLTVIVGCALVGFVFFTPKASATTTAVAATTGPAAVPPAAVPPAAVPSAAAPPAGGGSAAGGGGDSSRTDFFGHGDWGVGIGLVVNRGKLIPDASIVNGKVVANTTQTATTELMLAYHWYFAEPENSGTPTDGKLRCTITPFHACLGAFMALGEGVGNTTSQSFPDLFALGLLLGWGNNDDSSIESQPYNFGIGIGERFAVKTLADGFEPGKPAPNGETSVRYQTKDNIAYMIFFTYAFGAPKTPR